MKRVGRMEYDSLITDSKDMNTHCEKYNNIVF